MPQGYAKKIQFQRLLADLPLEVGDPERRRCRIVRQRKRRRGRGRR
jgi:hypothetical protein